MSKYTTIMINIIYTNLIKDKIVYLKEHEQCAQIDATLK